MPFVTVPGFPVNLSAERAQAFQQAFENNRQLEATIAEMRSLSRQILEAQTEDVKRRKPK